MKIFRSCTSHPLPFFLGCIFFYFLINLRFFFNPSGQCLFRNPMFAWDCSTPFFLVIFLFFFFWILRYCSSKKFTLYWTIRCLVGKLIKQLNHNLKFKQNTQTFGSCKNFKTFDSKNTFKHSNIRCCILRNSKSKEWIGLFRLIRLAPVEYSNGNIQTFKISKNSRNDSLETLNKDWKIFNKKLLIKQFSQHYLAFLKIAFYFVTQKFAKNAESSLKTVF